jgi:hypothetical protein
MATLASLIVDLTLQNAQFLAGINQANTQLGALNKSVAVAGAAIKGLAVGFGSAFTVQGIVTATTATFAWADSLQEAAERVGATVEQMQRLQRAGELTNVSQEQITTNLEQFTRRLGDAARGTGQLGAVLQGLNIDLRNQDGSLRSTAEVFDDYAEAIVNAETEQEALSLGVAGFGRSGGVFVTTIRQMSEGMGEFSVLTKGQIELLGKYDDKITAVGQRFEFEFRKRLVTTIKEVEALGRIFTNTADAILGSLDEIIGTSFAEELIGQSRLAAEGMADLELAISRVGSSAAGAAPAVDELTDAIRKANSAAGEGLADIELLASNLHVEEAKKEVAAFEANLKAKETAARQSAERMAREAERAAEEQIRFDQQKAERIADSIVRISEQTLQRGRQSARDAVEERLREQEKMAEELQRQQERSAEEQARIMMEPQLEAVRSIQTPLCSIDEPFAEIAEAILAK